MSCRRTAEASGRSAPYSDPGSTACTKDPGRLQSRVLLSISNGSRETGMGLGKQARTLNRGQVDAMVAYLSTTRHAKRDDQRLPGPDRLGNLPARLCQQGQVRTTNPLKRGSQESADRDRDEVLSKARPNDLSPAGPLVIKTERSQSTSPQAIVNMFQRWYRRTENYQGPQYGGPILSPAGHAYQRPAHEHEKASPYHRLFRRIGSSGVPSTSHAASRAGAWPRRA